jgi:hypothetical protein
MKWSMKQKECEKELENLFQSLMQRAFNGSWWDELHASMTERLHALLRFFRIRAVGEQVDRRSIV